MRSLGVILFTGIAIPHGWADGFTHSPASKTKCESLILELPSYARTSTSIVKIDPNAKTPTARH
jgi:hypothetical protein